MAKLKIDRITTDPRLQHREAAKDLPGCATQELTDEYAEAIKNGAKFPPVKAVEDKEHKTLWLYDGFHTLAAHGKLGKTHVEADVIEGDFDKALELSWQSNSEHGEKRKKGDMKNVLRSFFGTKPKMRKAAGHEIARQTKISERWCRAIRAELEEEGFFKKPEVAAKDKPEPAAAADGAAAEGNGEPDGSATPAGAAKGRGTRGGKKKGKGQGKRGRPAGVTAPRAVKDKEGRVVPEDLPALVAVFKTPVVDGALDTGNTFRDTINSVKGTNPWINYAEFNEQMERLMAMVAGAVPHSVCPACQGKECERCRNSGYLPEAHYLDLVRQLELEEAPA